MLYDNIVRYLNCSLSLLTRSICLRRLRLLKIYMVLLVTILILIVYFKSHESFQYSDGPTAGSAASSFGTLEDIVNVSGVKHQSGLMEDSWNKYLKQTPDLDGNASLNNDPPSRVHKNFALKTTPNFTHSLSARDFNQHQNLNIMQVRIREAAKHSWDSYKRYAWGFDMLKPLSKEPDHWFDLGLTIVDATDTLIMMGLTQDALLGLDWIENDLKFNSRNENSNCFEMTIRILAGLLSAYHLTGREKLKQQAIEFGDILLHCYDTDSRIIPYSDIDLSTRRAHPPQWYPHSSLSEVTSLQLEFRYLTQITGNPVYEDTTFQTSLHVHNLTTSRKSKLLPMYINPVNCQFEDSKITLGARADSYYEYLLKQYIQTGIKWLEEDYLDSIDEINDVLIKHTDGVENYTFIAEMQIYQNINETEERKYFNKMDHLVCFLPGTLVLGYYRFSPQASEYRLKYNLETPTDRLNPRYDRHIDIARALARTCYHMYSKMGTGLSPEIASFVHSSSDDPTIQNQPELQVQSTDAHNILRPEYVESLFYLYHITGLPAYRIEASQIFEAFQKYSRIPSGYAAISDVRLKPSLEGDIDETLRRHAPDRMESFWLSETLKYLYLIFCDDRHIIGTILNHYVFNTEGHLLPIA